MLWFLTLELILLIFNPLSSSYEFLILCTDVRVYISPQEYVASEDEGFVTITLIKSKDIEIVTTVGVTLITFDNSATGTNRVLIQIMCGTISLSESSPGGQDFASRSWFDDEILFPPDVYSVDVAIQILQDNIPEKNETFFIRLGFGPGPVNVDYNDRQTVTILDSNGWWPTGF